jgi:LysM repeat protein
MKFRLPTRKPAPTLQRPPTLRLKASVARSRRAPIIEDEDDFLDEPEPNMKLSHAFVVVLVLHVIAVAGVFAFNSIKTRQADTFSAVKADPAAAAEAPALAQSASGTTTPAGPASDPSTGANSSQPGDSNPPAPAATSPAPSPKAIAGGKTHEMQPGDTLVKIAADYGVTVSALEQANSISDPRKLRAGTVLIIPEGGSPKPAATPAVAAPVKPVETSVTATNSGNVKDSGQMYTVEKGDNPVKIAKKLKVPYAELMALNGNPDPRKLQIGQKLKVPASAKK